MNPFVESTLYAAIQRMNKVDYIIANSPTLTDAQVGRIGGLIDLAREDIMSAMRLMGMTDMEKNSNPTLPRTADE